MLGSFWDDPKILESVFAHVGIVSESFSEKQLHRVGIIIGSFWDDLWMMLGLFWELGGVSLGSVWARYGIIFGSFNKRTQTWKGLDGFPNAG